MNKRNSNPVALVTGAGRRLGRQIALALAQNGFDVVVNYSNSRNGALSVVKNIQSLGQRSIAIRADISKRAQVNAMVTKAIAFFGRIDVLVNNAAVFVTGSLESTTDGLWDKSLDINLKGTFLCAQAVSKYMMKQKGGRIINIASIGGIQAWKEHLPYNVSKAGVMMLTRVLAKNLAPHITVNAIAPGTIIMEGEEDASVTHVSTNIVPLGRYGKPDDIISTVLFLVKNASYITGQVIAVDGGRTI
jgi:NAD(P)-dependent dehydrogenase (short-subunit alcohol dehydrogenase family)